MRDFCRRLFNFQPVEKFYPPPFEDAILAEGNQTTFSHFPRNENVTGLRFLECETFSSFVQTNEKTTKEKLYSSSYRGSFHEFPRLAEVLLCRLQFTLDQEVLPTSILSMNLFYTINANLCENKRFLRFRVGVRSFRRTFDHLILEDGVRK